MKIGNSLNNITLSAPSDSGASSKTEEKSTLSSGSERTSGRDSRSVFPTAPLASAVSNGNRTSSRLRATVPPTAIATQGAIQNGLIVIDKALHEIDDHPQAKNLIQTAIRNLRGVLEYPSFNPPLETPQHPRSRPLPPVPDQVPHDVSGKVSGSAQHPSPVSDEPESRRHPTNSPLPPVLDQVQHEVSGKVGSSAQHPSPVSDEPESRRHPTNSPLPPVPDQVPLEVSGKMSNFTQKPSSIPDWLDTSANKTQGNATPLHLAGGNALSDCLNRLSKDLTPPQFPRLFTEKDFPNMPQGYVSQHVRTLNSGFMQAHNIALNAWVSQLVSEVQQVAMLVKKASEAALAAI